MNTTANRLAAVFICLICSRETLAQGRIETHATPTGTTIRYQDPAYDNAWREFVVPRQPVDAEVVSNVEKVGDTWFYTFEIRSRSTAAARYWRAQLASDAELTILDSWECVRSAPANSIVTCEYRGNAPPETVRWTASSSKLPDIRTMSIRSTPSIETSIQDMPQDVKALVSRLERDGAAEAFLIGPWIATDREIQKVHHPKPLTTILSEVEASFLPAAREIGEELSDLVIGFRRVNEALRQGRRSEAMQMLASMLQSSPGEAESSAGLAVRSAIRVIAEFASARLRDEP